MKVLFMDTEGLGSMDTSQEHDARVFALATLLCSYLVYNRYVWTVGKPQYDKEPTYPLSVLSSVGAIDEDALGSLSFIANLSRHIQVKTEKELVVVVLPHYNGSYVGPFTFQTKGSDNANEENPSDSSTSFPDFLWVLRDFTLNLEDEVRLWSLIF